MCQTKAQGGRRCRSHSVARFRVAADRHAQAPTPATLARLEAAATVLASVPGGKSDVGSAADEALRAGDTGTAAALDRAAAAGQRRAAVEQDQARSRVAGDRLVLRAAGLREPSFTEKEIDLVLGALRAAGNEPEAEPGASADAWRRWASGCENKDVRRDLKALARSGGPEADGMTVAAWRRLPEALAQARVRRDTEAWSTAGPDGTRTWTGTHSAYDTSWSAIEGEGFREGTGESGFAGAHQVPVWGSGVYVALDEPGAAMWDGQGRSRRTVTVRAGHVLAYDYGAYGERRRDLDVIAREAAVCAPSPGPEFLAACETEADRCARFGDRPDPASPDVRGRTGADLRRSYAQKDPVFGTNRYLRSLGWDALLITEPAATRHAGGNQLVVLDPARVRVSGFTGG